MALLHVDFFSDVLGMCQQMDVILPEQTHGQIGMEGVRGEGKYPVLYLLHGMSDDHTIWQRRTSIERYASDYGIAVVMPTTQLGWYTDMHIGYKWWTYISKELPAICRSFFPYMSDKREDTFAAGLSMGGYGAFRLTLTKPEQYSAAASLSGCLDIIARLDDCPWKNEATAIWGEDFASSARGTDSDLMYLLDRYREHPDAQRPRLFAACGTEDMLYSSNIDFCRRIEGCGFDFRFTESAGSHSWKFWEDNIVPALDFFLGGLAQLQAEGHVIINRHMGIQRVVLEYHGDVAILGRDVVYQFVADVQLALGDFFQAGNHAQGGGLTAAGGADQNDKFLVFDIQAEIAYRGNAAGIYFVNVIKGYACHNKIPPLSRPSTQALGISAMCFYYTEKAI